MLCTHLIRVRFHAQEPTQNDKQGPEQGGGGRGRWGGILAGSANGDGRISKRGRPPGPAEFNVRFVAVHEVVYKNGI